MSLDLEDQLKQYLASAPQNKFIVQVVEISHSAMSKTFYLWREPFSGQVTDENDNVLNVEPLNMEVELAGDRRHLDQEFSFTLDTTNVTDEFRNQVESIPIDSTEKIRLVYREYLSDNLLEPLAVVPLQVESISYTIGKATLSAVSPRLNINRTGALYTYKRFPGLRGFI